MRLMNPWENIMITMINKPTHIQNFDHHIHILYVLSGEITIYNANVSYILPTNGFFILPNATTFDVMAAHAQCYELSLCYEFNNESPYDYEFQGDSHLGGGPLDEELIRIVNKLLELYYLEKNSATDVEVLHYYFAFLNHLEKKYYKKKTTSKGKKTKASVEEVKYYIDNNFDKDIRLSDLANMLFISEQHLSRLFSKEVGKSIRDYIQEKRLEKVKYDLLHSEDTITDIVYHAGFDNINSFNRIFKRMYKENPSSYRMKYKRESEVETINADKDEPEILHKIKHNIQNENVIQELDVYVDAGSQKKKADIIVNVHHIENLLRHDFLAQLEFFNEQVDVQYIRMPLAFDKINLKDNMYDFSYIDRVLQVVQKRNISPYFVIENLDQSVYEICHAFFKHALYRYGSCFVNCWKIEFQMHSTAITTWVHDFLAIKKMRDHMGITCSLGIGNLDISLSIESKLSLIHALKKGIKECDFLGVKAIPASKKESEYQDRKHIYEYSKKEYIAQHALEYVEILEKNNLSKTFYLTEFGLLDNVDAIYDMSMIGMLITRIYKTLRHVFAAIGFVGFSDLDYEHKEGNDKEFSGKPGIFTMHGIPKIGCYAYMFMEHIYDYVIYEDDYLIISADADENISIAAYMYLEVDSSYCSSTKISMQDEGFIFVPEKHKTIKLTIHGLSKGQHEYNFMAGIIDRNYGNAFDEWKKTSSIHCLDNDMIEYLACKSIPKKYYKKEKYTDGCIQLNIYIEPNQLVLLKLDKLY